jgi:hypothetical protein
VLVAFEEGRNLLDSPALNPDTKNQFEAPAREYREELVELIRAAPPAPELPG